jgi:hypothetical protein
VPIAHPADELGEVRMHVHVKSIAAADLRPQTRDYLVGGGSSAGGDMVGALVTAGLLGAWLVHDAEEWITMPAWSERAASRHPGLPRALIAMLRISRLEATVAIGTVGLVVAAAAGAGLSTDGRSEFFQLVLLAFGLHSVVHVLQSVLLRGYTPGLVTAIIVVAPYSAWAWLQVRHARIVNVAGASWTAAIGLFVVVVLGARLIAMLITRLRSSASW